MSGWVGENGGLERGVEGGADREGRRGMLGFEENFDGDLG